MTGQIIQPLIGGVLIGVASSLMLVGAGRIAGISGIVGNILGKFQMQFFWRYSFLIGLMFSSLVMVLISPEKFEYEFGSNYALAIIAGLVVGIGTRLGSGCTSGHGVCGISRFSVRSIAATLTFIIFGIVTVLIMRELYGTKFL